MKVSQALRAAAAITLLFLVIMSLIAGVQTRFIRAALVEEIASRQQAQVTSVAADLDGKLETRLLALAGEAAEMPAILSRPEDIQQYLARQASMYLLFDALLVVSPNGTILADWPQVVGRRGLDVSGREYFKRSSDVLKPVVSAPYLARAAQRPTVTMMAPILDREGQLLGFLAGTLDLLKPTFLGAIASAPIGETGHFFIITKSDPSVYVVHPDRRLLLQPSTDAGGVGTNKRQLNGEDGTREGVDAQGVAAFFSYRSLTTTNWLLGAYYPLTEALAPVVGAERRLWIVLGILVTLLAPLFWLLAGFLTTPLQRLHEDVRRMRETTGGMSEKLQARRDEIGDLARDFNALIAERHEGAEALRRSTRLLDNIVENLPAAIQIKDVNDSFRILLWNKAAETMYGLPRERVIGRTVLETWSPDDARRLYEADRLAVLSKGQEYTNRPQVTAHRGSITVHMRKVPLYDDTGAATHLLVIADDVTERVAADGRLARSEASFRGAAESALDAFLILDSVRDETGDIRDFRFRYLNSNAERMLAQLPGLAIGQCLSDIFPEWAEKNFDRFTEVVTSGIPLDENFTASVADASIRWFHHQVVRLEDGIAITLRDISERRRAEEELRSNRTFLQSLIDHLPMAIYVKDVRPDRAGEIVVWSGAAANIAGVSAHEALGKTDEELFGAEVYGEVERHDRELLASRVMHDIPEHPFRRADGRVVFLHTTSIPLIGADGAVEFILRISDDVTARRRQEKELRAKSAELLAVNDASPLGMFRTDTKGRWTYVNRTYEDISGLGDAQAQGDGWMDAVHTDDRARVTREWNVALSARQPFMSLHRYRHGDGRVVWASVRATRVVADGADMGYVGSVDDTTARREAEQAVVASEHRLRTITDTMPAWIAYVDRQEVYRFTNVAFERAFNLDREALRGRTISDVLGESQYTTVKPYLSRVFAGETVTFERKEEIEGQLRWAEATYIPEFDDSTREVVGCHAMLRDVTAQKLEEQRLLRLSEIDSLTGLANRVGFEQRLGDAMLESAKTGQTFAVMYVDIDHFKKVNDTFGHATGDALLHAFAQRLRASVRKTDTVARLGGDEFVVIMEQIPEPGVAAKLAAKALQQIARPLLLPDHSVHSITASIGVAFHDGGRGTAPELLAEADAMLYAAKGAGRGTFQVAPWQDGRQANGAADNQSIDGADDATRTLDATT